MHAGHIGQLVDNVPALDSKKQCGDYADVSDTPGTCIACMLIVAAIYVCKAPSNQTIHAVNAPAGAREPNVLCVC